MLRRSPEEEGDPVDKAGPHRRERRKRKGKRRRKEDGWLSAKKRSRWAGPEGKKKGGVGLIRPTKVKEKGFDFKI